MKPTGTCWVNLGDTYYNNSSQGSNDGRSGFAAATAENFTHGKGGQGSCLICGKPTKTQFCSKECLNKKGNDFRTQNRLLPNKTLCLIPHRFAIEMINRGWILRNTIIWHKPNCMPSSAKDRFTVDFEYVFFFVKQKKYFFDTQYEEQSPHTLVAFKNGKVSQSPKSLLYPDEIKAGKTQQAMRGKDWNAILPLGRNKRTVWSICPQPFPEAHFAVYPEELCQTPLKSGCPEFVCKKCGKAREKILEPSEEYSKLLRNQGKGWSSERRYEAMKIGNALTEGDRHDITADYKFKGYTKCSCNAGFEGGIVLDPFIGAGTTALVALKQNKRFIGFEINQQYIDIANKRIKPYLEQRKLVFPTKID